VKTGIETMIQKYVGLAIVLALLAGCGNKGPLYLPDDARAKQEQAK
jgi:predicted small lipoprotein YifL